MWDTRNSNTIQIVFRTSHSIIHSSTAKLFETNKKFGLDTSGYRERFHGHTLKAVYVVRLRLWLVVKTVQDVWPYKLMQLTATVRLLVLSASPSYDFDLQCNNFQLLEIATRVTSSRKTNLHFYYSWPLSKRCGMRRKRPSLQTL